MTGRTHYENQWAALWKSAATEALARRSGDTGPAAGLADSHPVTAGIDRYLESLSAGVTPTRPDPAASDPTDPEVVAYLALLHHRLAHATIAKDAALQADLTRQLAEFQFGDAPWQEMMIQYVQYYWQYPRHLGGQPTYRSWQETGKGDLDYGTIAWRLPKDATIVIVGDVGTGTDLAAATLSAAMTFHPDAVLHLGDVYYSGTAFEMERRFVGLFDAVFQAGKDRVPVFTVPGNHEYFTGGIPLLDCLDSGRLTMTADQAQVASYFCLRSADDAWQFLGLDTGYNGHAMSVPPKDVDATLRLLHANQPDVPVQPDPDSVAAPAAPPPVVTLRDDEVTWHRDKMRGFPGRSILLSHHQLYSAKQSCGAAQGSDPSSPDREWVNTGLWSQLGADLDHVAAWIWGHEHNLGIYADGYRPADWPEDLAGKFPPLAKGRCAGHAAIPVQESEAPYQRVYPVPLVRDDAVLGTTDGWYHRGFEVLDLLGAGQPARLRYFQVADVDAEPQLVYEETVT